MAIIKPQGKSPLSDLDLALNILMPKLFLLGLSEGQGYDTSLEHRIDGNQITSLFANLWSG